MDASVVMGVSRKGFIAKKINLLLARKFRHGTG